MTKQPHSRIPRPFTRRPLAAILLCLLCLDLAAYRIAETPVVTDTLPDPPLVAVGDDVFVWMYGGKSLVFDPDDEYTEGSCGYGFDWQNCKNGPHDHLHGHVRFHLLAVIGEVDVEERGVRQTLARVGIGTVAFPLHALVQLFDGLVPKIPVFIRV